MQSLPFSDDGSPQITPNLSRKSSSLPVNSGRKSQGSFIKEKVSFTTCIFIFFVCLLILSFNVISIFHSIYLFRTLPQLFVLDQDLLLKMLEFRPRNQMLCTILALIN